MEFEYTLTTNRMKFITFDRCEAVLFLRKHPDANASVVLRGGNHDKYRRARNAREYEKALKRKDVELHNRIVKSIMGW